MGKVCTKCKEEKEFKEFYKDKYCKDGYYSSCKRCCKTYDNKHYQNNKEKIKKKIKDYTEKNIGKISKRRKKYYKQNRDKILKIRREFNNKNPWYNSYNHAKQRCENFNYEDYYRYGGRGIKFLLTKEECAKLWERDKGWLLKHHSIDREDNDGNYTYDNCGFIEMNKNSGKDKTKSILQFDLDGNFIREWISIGQASDFYNVYIGAISSVLRNKSKTSCGYIWKYKKIK